MDRAGVPATIPAAMAVLDVAASGLAPGHLREIDQIAEEFLSSVEAAEQDPLDPEYQDRWRESQQASDARMKALYGTQAWMKHHVEAHRQVHASP